ncbi:head-tail connector protein [Paludibacterium denitrificans]|uniref:Phage gp6-like head-tail connector protein n=1 Tax=Paludibacterium denitrificans TaxID=2675226 RepID=A0A844G8H7_9NEIS|nr:head-tail connector protein [Paludibacterium denitrificans]MTD32623.1 hypothetical protein [Paludibacterium denitrificans]MTD34089.1 hypothetical protein [Paludibacterium denitrificans]
MSAVLIERSTASVLELADIKRQCRIDDDLTEDDSLLVMLEKAAVRACEKRIRGPVLTATYMETLAEWPAVPRLTLQTAGAFEVTDIALSIGGNPFPRHDFHALPSPPALQIKPHHLAPACGAIRHDGHLHRSSRLWPHVDAVANAIQIRYKAGLAETGDNVPEDVRQWLLFTIGTLYEYRERFVVGQTVTEVPGGFVDSLLDPYTLREVTL